MPSKRRARACSSSRPRPSPERRRQRIAARSHVLFPTKQKEVAAHYRAVAGATALPLCIYNNPGITRFTFSDALIADLATVPGIVAIKMPLPADADYAAELARLRATPPDTFAIGYSGDWGATASLLAGGTAWYSVVAGLLPELALHLTRAAQAGRQDEAEAMEAAFAPLWALFKAHGSLGLLYAIADRLPLSVGAPPPPLLRAPDPVVAAIPGALDRLGV
ncbi:dihydrodipicolinate synthase family protein [uncultured Sphingomonas sp.]|uniref:dihydrodipicolinate synthase family protein n=1 Tax=uncultured Sphingomonas sp. TaxID=158754 RepID=UPI0025E3B158|nr:dihydrodipicolinate synthase family protein [uncultured Sphingomonas sp.]